MKSLATFLAVLFATSAASAQGTVTFNNRDVTAGVDFKIGIESSVFLEGPGWSAQLWGGLTADSLAPAFPITTFRSGAAAGYVVGTMATLTGVPLDAPSAYVQIRVWDNAGGTVNSWGDVLASDPDGLTIGRGVSEIVVLNNIGGNFNTPPNLVGFSAFDVTVPEPSTWVLGLLAGAALLCRFRIAPASPPAISRTVPVHESE
jgi:hypothetical protein